MIINEHPSPHGLFAITGGLDFEGVTQPEGGRVPQPRNAVNTSLQARWRHPCGQRPLMGNTHTPFARTTHDVSLLPQQTQIKPMHHPIR